MRILNTEQFNEKLNIQPVSADRLRSVGSARDMVKQKLYRKLSKLKSPFFGSMTNTRLKIRLTENELNLLNEIVESESESGRFSDILSGMIKAHLPFQFGKNEMMLPVWNAMLDIFDGVLDDKITPNLAMTLIIKKE